MTTCRRSQTRYDKELAHRDGMLLCLPRDKRPPHDYSLADYGLTEAGIAAAFSEYRERFIESRA